MTGSKVAAVGHYQPARILTNDELSTMVDTNDEWIRSRVGISTRHIAASDETVASMAAAAAKKALAQSGLSSDLIDMVIVATCSAVDRSPNTAGRVARALGLQTPAVIDVNVVCSGFAHVLAIADQAIQAGSATHALVIGVDKMSDWTDWTDRSSCVLMGDGAGALLLSATDRPEVGPVLWGSVPQMSDSIRIEGRDGFFAQDGQRVFRWTTTALPAIARTICERSGISPEDLGAVVLHQANLRIIEQLASKLGATNAVIATDVVDSGNTSAGSIPIALSKLLERREVTSGAPILLFGFGGGLAYAGQIIRCP